MTRGQSWLDRVAERVMDLESEAYGDERERAVVMESSSFGMTTGLYAAVWYAKRRGVSLSELAENAGARSTMISIVVYGAAMVLTFAAMAYTGYMGHSIVQN